MVPRCRYARSSWANDGFSAHTAGFVHVGVTEGRFAGTPSATGAAEGAALADTGAGGASSWRRDPSLG